MTEPERRDSIAEADLGSSPDSELAQPVPKEDTWPSDLCWFCESRAPADEAGISVPLAKGLDAPGKYVATAANVPRCKHCRHVHRLTRYVGWLANAIFAVAVFGGIMLVLGLSSTTAGNLAFAGGMVGAFILSIALWQLSEFLLSRILVPDKNETKPKGSEEFSYPLVKALREEGWSEYVYN